MKTLRFGIVGCGSIASTHADILPKLPGVTLAAVADVLPERVRAFAEKFVVPVAYNSAEELIADPMIDAIVFCTPSGIHADGAVAAMHAGKHVVVEKPMDVTLAAADRIIDAQRKTGRCFTVISQHRFDPATISVKDAIDSGKLGKIILADASVKWWRTQKYYDEGGWRGTWKLDGGGALMNQGVHTVDVLQWLVGGVETVSGHYRTGAHKMETEDIAVAALSFKCGAVGTLTATTAAYDGQPVRIDIFGTEGSAIIEGDRLKLLTLKNGEKYVGEEAAAHAVSVARGGTASVTPAAPTNDPAAKSAASDPTALWGGAHKAQLLNFLHAIREGSHPLITAADGRKPLEIILALYESSRTGSPVKLT